MLKILLASLNLLINLRNTNSATLYFTPPSKLFFPIATVSKFPPIIEYFVQRIQAANSNYIYEDLSRPPTWEKPIYTLSQADMVALQQIMEAATPPTVLINRKKTTTNKYDNFEYEELEDTTEQFFEKIPPFDPFVIEYKKGTIKDEKTFEVKNNPSNYIIIPYQGRQGIIASWIQNSGWFPIEINVPDLISGIGNGIQSGWNNVTSGIAGFISNLGDRFPFINRIPIGQRPKPEKIIVLVPAEHLQGAENHLDTGSMILEDDLII